MVLQRQIIQDVEDAIILVIVVLVVVRDVTVDVAHLVEELVKMGV